MSAATGPDDGNGRAFQARDCWGHIGATFHRRITDNSGHLRSTDPAAQPALSVIIAGRPSTRVLSRTEGAKLKAGPGSGRAGKVWLALPRGTLQAWRCYREGRRRGPNSEPLVRSFGNTRTCAADGCDTQLSRYNPARCCYLHEGWDLEPVTRPRRRAPESPVAAATANDSPVD